MKTRKIVDGFEAIGIVVALPFIGRYSIKIALFLIAWMLLSWVLEQWLTFRKQEQK